MGSVGGEVWSVCVVLLCCCVAVLLCLFVGGWLMVGWWLVVVVVRAVCVCVCVCACVCVCVCCNNPDKRTVVPGPGLQQHENSIDTQRHPPATSSQQPLRPSVPPSHRPAARRVSQPLFAPRTRPAGEQLSYERYISHITPPPLRSGRTRGQDNGHSVRLV